MLDPISVLVGAIIGGVVMVWLTFRTVNRIARIAAAACRKRDELLFTVVKPLLAEVIAYRRGEAAGEEDEIEQEEIEI